MNVITQWVAEKSRSPYPPFCAQTDSVCRRIDHSRDHKSPFYKKSIRPEEVELRSPKFPQLVTEVRRFEGLYQPFCVDRRTPADSIEGRLIASFKPGNSDPYKIVGRVLKTIQTVPTT